MKLTRRQEKFIQKMIELKREFASPIHYSLLAERLGVSPFTAYDMLCLLEEKGYVTSEYQLPADKCGPGRAERVFYLSEMAQAQHQQIVDQFGGKQPDVEALKTFALEKLRKGETPDQELTEQMMARLVPTGHRELRYCTEVITIAALRLRGSPGQKSFMKHLPELLPDELSPGDNSPGVSGTCKANLCLLGGFVYGLLVQHGTYTPEWLEKLREHMQGYLELVMGMNAGDCTRLAGHLRAVFASLAEAQG
jgi:DNA-binding PadR family transcriptional regulator